MELKHTISKNSRINHSLAIIFSCLFIFLIWHKSGIYFETNDDRYITSLLSGVITGSPEPIVYYINYFITLPLSILYRIAANIPWYGMFLTCLYIVGYAILLDSLYAKCKSYLETALSTILCGTLCISFWYILGKIQYTSATIFFASIGYACMILDSGKKHPYAKFCFCEILSILVRKEAMFLVQPIGMGTYLGLLFFSKKHLTKEKIKKCGYAWAVIIVALVIELFGSFLGGYFKRDLREYIEFNDNEVQLFDYYPTPTSNEISDILNRNGLSPILYDSYINYNNVTYDMTICCQKEIIQSVSAKYPRKFENIIKGITSLYQQEQQWNINHLSFLFLTIIVTLSIYLKDLSLIFCLLGMWSGKLIVWGFLFYRGRVLNRVSVSLFFLETLLLAAVIFYAITQKELQQKRRYIFLSILTITSLSIGFPSARQQYHYVQQTNEGQQIYMNSLREVIDYCREHDQQRFILEAISFSYYLGSAFETEIYHPENYIISGGWFSYLPPVRQHVTEFISLDDEIYLIVNAEESKKTDAILKYYQTITRSIPISTDQIITSSGVIYNVVCFPSNKKSP